MVIKMRLRVRLLRSALFEYRPRPGALNEERRTEITCISLLTVSPMARVLTTRLNTDDIRQHCLH